MYQVLYKKEVIETFQTIEDAIKYKAEIERLLMDDDNMVSLYIRPITINSN